MSNFSKSKTLETEHTGSATLVLSELIHEYEKSKKKNFYPVAIKIFKEGDLEKDNGNLVEVKIYEGFIKPILEKKQSPNFIAPIGHVVCRTSILNIISLMGNDCDKITLAKNLQNIIDTDLLPYSDVNYVVLKNLIQMTNENDLYLMIMEFPLQSINYQQFLLSKPSKSDILATLFQILYSLKVLNQCGIQHNDLHFGNIFVIAGNLKQKYYEKFITFQQNIL